MRPIYEPPSTRTNLPLVFLGATLITLAVFLVLPLTQMISSGVQKQYDLSQVDTAAPPPPPELSEIPKQLSLSDLDLDLGMGGGGFLGGGAIGVDQVGLEEVAIFDMADLDQRPQAIARVEPRHPRELLKAKIEGYVVLLFVIDEEGRVMDPRVETSSHPEFETAALKALTRWRFKPGTVDGKQVRTFVRQKIDFRIN
ncbi:MAG: energy transducer TonB [Verrucomicrobia bacterium]|nr:energy transducer TonB [Verrucomicrobiota bacterium]